MERSTILTGLRLTPSQHAKRQRMAAALGVSPNKLTALLIEAAHEPEPRPALVVGEIKNNSRSAQTFQGKGATAVLV